MACATCHHPKFGYTEDRDVSIGVNGVGLGARRHFVEPNSIPFVKRNSQTILNTAFNGIDETGSYRPSERRGRDRNPHVSREQLDPLLRQLRGVDDDDEDLMAFLDALNDGSFDRTVPRRVPSGLPPGGKIQ